MKQTTFPGRKIFILIFLFINSLSFAQTWEMVDNTGFGYSSLQISGLKPFKDRFFAACGHIGTPGAFIFSSTSGNSGTWGQEMNYATLMNANQMNTSVLNSTTAAGGWLHAGTKNYTDGPIVLKSYDGSAWDSLPHIPFVNPIGNYYEISAITYFTSTGGDDSILVAVRNGTDGPEIWKNDYAGSGPWTNVLDFAPGMSTAFTDMVVFNNKVYACTDGALIYESSDGNNWAMNFPADTGFNDIDNSSFTAMEVFQNKLYVSTYNTTDGAQIWNTADGITWNPIITDGFTNGGNLYGINDLLVANGKLWVSAYSWMSGLAAFAPPSGETRGGSEYTYVYATSDGTTFINYNNDAFGGTNRRGYLGYFQNFVYQGSNNFTWSWAEVWRLCQAPTPTISPASGVACLGTPIWVNDTLYTAVTNDWYVNDTLQYSGTGGFYFTPTFLGTQTIKLIERNGTCVDSTTTTITVYPIPNSNPTSNQPYCYGTEVTLFDTISGGTGPYSVHWHDELGFSATGVSIVVTALTNFDVYATVTDANGCESNGVLSGFTVTPSTDLFGHVSYSGGNVTSGNAVAFRFKSGYSYFDTIQVAPLNASGDYLFTALNSDSLLIKVFADTLAYPLLNPTYYGNEWAWDSATVFIHGCSVNDTANITMIEELGVGSGIGMITGTIIEGVGFGSLMMASGDVRLPGEPIPGIDVKLGKNPGGAMVTSGSTNGSGVYTFTGVDFNTAGEYYTVYVDIPGLGRDSSYSVTVDATNNQFYNLDYYVDSTTIYIVGSTVGITNPEMAAENKFSVFPNPSKGTATIEYTIENDSDVQLEIYNVLGVKISSLVNSTKKSGTYKYTTSNLNLSSGIYFISLRANNKIGTQRLIITE
ncbi:MAG: T9SS type A sorting domain-containing protein [Bacteroidetes bacterium]|nr:T9SS type A sorting domain-containing protein [Bacteroidota bacterium]